MIAAAVEGEIAYVAAAALVGRGYLDPIAVAFAGAAGAALGDQFYFYLLRGRLERWLHRSERIARRGHALAQEVRRREVPMVMMIRFAPGLRIALAAACAYAGVAPLKFSAISCATSLVWAGGLMALVAWVGPTALPKIGLSGWWTALVPGLIIVIIFRVMGRVERRALLHGSQQLDNHAH